MSLDNAKAILDCLSAADFLWDIITLCDSAYKQWKHSDESKYRYRKEKSCTTFLVRGINGLLFLHNKKYDIPSMSCGVLFLIELFNMVLKFNNRLGLNNIYLNTITVITGLMSYSLISSPSHISSDNI